MTRRYSFRLLFAALAALPLGLLVGQPAPQRPYVVLVSLDGFRYDYAAKYHATHLVDIGKAGAAAEAMIPSFPTITFPNHISIVTGQYPGHHGLVSNAFYDPQLKQMYSMRNSADESAFYRYQPLWVVAEQQHVRTAAMFWPTSDAEIAGVRPSYWKKFDDSFPNEKRVEQVIEWLKLPATERPHFITLYYSDVDHAGHSFGPDALETAQAVQRVDKLVGDLWAGLRKSGLPVNLIVVSDHGMQKIEGVVNVGEFADLSKVRVVNEGPMLLLYPPNPETTEALYQKLKGHSPIFDVYRRQETPERWHYRDSDRIGDLVVYVHGANVALSGPPNRAPHGGAHGFDEQEFKTMDAIFYAAGPNIKPGVVLKPFENVNVFPFLTKILGLTNPPDIDGKESILDAAYLK